MQQTQGKVTGKWLACCMYGSIAHTIQAQPLETDFDLIDYAHSGHM